VSVAASLIHGSVSPIVLFPPSAGLAGEVRARAILKPVLRFFTAISHLYFHYFREKNRSERVLRANKAIALLLYEFALKAIFHAIAL
jgi:hypothetical protein